MGNQPTHSTIVRTTPSRDEVVNARWLGWCDASAGLGYRATYNAMDEWSQRAYERGRLTAVAVISAGGEPPKWRRSETAPTMSRRIRPPEAWDAYRAEVSYTALKRAAA